MSNTKLTGLFILAVGIIMVAPTESCAILDALSKSGKYNKPGTIASAAAQRAVITTDIDKPKADHQNVGVVRRCCRNISDLSKRFWKWFW